MAKWRNVRLGGCMEFLEFVRVPPGVEATVDIQCHLRYHSAMIITIDRAGRVVLPKAVRERFHLVPGTELELTTEADGVRLAVRATQPALVTRQGVLVHHGPAPVALDIAAFINKTRESRSLDVVEGHPA